MQDFLISRNADVMYVLVLWLVTQKSLHCREDVWRCWSATLLPREGGAAEVSPVCGRGQSRGSFNSLCSIRRARELPIVACPSGHVSVAENPHV